MVKPATMKMMNWHAQNEVNNKKVKLMKLIGNWSETWSDAYRSKQPAILGYWHRTVVYCLSVGLFMTKCTVAKRYILQQKCLNKWIGSVPSWTVDGSIWRIQ